MTEHEEQVALIRLGGDAPCPGVYVSKDKAFKLASESCHYYVTESDLDEEE
jgi:hypothetical protein